MSDRSSSELLLVCRISSIGLRRKETKLLPISESLNSCLKDTLEGDREDTGVALVLGR